MRYPSVRTISDRLVTMPDTTKQIRAIMKTARGARGINTALDTINGLLHGYGVESIRDNQWDNYYQDIGLLYVNMGGTYTSTVVFDTRSGRFLVSSWGDIVERQERRFNV